MKTFEQISEEISQIRKELEAYKRASGYEPDPAVPMIVHQCQDPGHQPPSHVQVPFGMRYRHVCPGCYAVSYIYHKQK